MRGSYSDMVAGTWMARLHESLFMRMVPRLGNQESPDDKSVIWLAKDL